MQPNLKLHNITSLEFSTTIPLSNELAQKIRETSKPDSDGDSLFFDSYKGHRSLVNVKGIAKDAKGYEVEFTFEAVSGGRLPKRFPRVEQLVDIFSVVKEKLDFECGVAFIFGRSIHARSIIGLPMKYIEAPDMPFDMVQGVHLVKLDGNETKYEIFFEAPTRGVLFENVRFKYASTFIKSVADKILAEAEKISNKVVFRKGNDAKST